jgi:hypothetical protein
MRTQGYGSSEINAALSLYRHATKYARSRKEWASLNQEIEADSNQNWAMFDRGIPSDFWFSTRFDPISTMIRYRCYENFDSPRRTYWEICQTQA